MTVDMSLLTDEFRPIAEKLLSTMQEEGYKIRAVSGLRTPKEQAVIWRQGRSTELINDKIGYFRSEGLRYLADLIENAGFQSGKRVTYAFPGQSWHNFGEAMDVYIAPREGMKEDELYKIYADTARRLGLTAGYYFSSVDMGHVQLRSKEIPSIYSLKQINDMFLKKYG